MSININENPAGVLAIGETAQTFTSWSADVSKRTRKPLKHGNGQNIALNPESIYTTLLMEVKNVLSPEQFDAVLNEIQGAIVSLVQKGIIEPDWFRGLATPLDIAVPAVPTALIAAANARVASGEIAGYEHKTVLAGEVRLIPIENVTYPEPEIDDEEQNEEETT